MAKFKPARPKQRTPPARGAIPCILVLVFGMTLLFLLFYAILKAD